MPPGSNLHPPWITGTDRQPCGWTTFEHSDRQKALDGFRPRMVHHATAGQPSDALVERSAANHDQIMREWRFNFQDLTGRRFHRLTVVERAPSVQYANGNRATRWACVCDCGERRIVYAGGLKSGLIKSCGCFNRETARVLLTTHGKCKTREHTSWNAMISRCHNRNCRHYARYGGVGINVCDKWRKSFSAFLADMGERPAGCTPDRFPNKNGNYEPGNCRWATPKQQSRNMKSNRILTIDGKSLSVTEWAEITGVNRATAYSRLHRGISDKEAITP